MLKTRIIPCMDIKNGRIVKGVQFVDIIDMGDPVSVAQAYDQAGADELCFLDITATYENRDITFDLVHKTAEKCFMPFTVGGGIRTIETIRKLLRLGADKVSLNSAAIENPDIIAEASSIFGSQCIVVAIDAKRTKQTNQWEVFIKGGREATSIDAVQFAQFVASKGAGEILLTSIDQDGTKSGFDLDLTSAVSSHVPVPVIASGGVGNLEHLVEGVNKGGANAVLAASIFHTGQYSIRAAKQYMSQCGITMRLT